MTRIGISKESGREGATDVALICDYGLEMSDAKALIEGSCWRSIALPERLARELGADLLFDGIRAGTVRLIEQDFLHPHDPIVADLAEACSCLSRRIMESSWLDALLGLRERTAACEALGDRLFTALRLEFALHRAIRERGASRFHLASPRYSGIGGGAGAGPCRVKWERVDKRDAAKDWANWEAREAALDRAVLDRFDHTQRDGFRSTRAVRRRLGSVRLFLVDNSLANDDEHREVLLDCLRHSLEKGFSIALLGVAVPDPVRTSLEDRIKNWKVATYWVGGGSAVECAGDVSEEDRLAAALFRRGARRKVDFPMGYVPSQFAARGALLRFLRNDLSSLLAARRCLSGLLRNLGIGGYLAFGGGTAAKHALVRQLESTGVHGVTYYHLFASAHARFKRPLSERVAVRDPVSAHALESVGLHPTVVGSPVLERRLARWCTRREQAMGSVTVLVLTQRHYFKECLAMVEALAIEVARMPTWRLKIRCHPVEGELEKESYRRTALLHASEDDLVFGKGHEALDDALQNADLVVTLFSNAGYDASLVGIPVVQYLAVPSRIPVLFPECDAVTRFRGGDLGEMLRKALETRPPVSRPAGPNEADMATTTLFRLISGD